MASLREQFRGEFSEKEKQFEKKIDPNKEYRYQYTQVDNEFVIEAYNGKQIVYRAIYDRIGTFDLYSGVWRWAWCNSMIDKTLAEKSKKVKEFAQKIEKNYSKYDFKEADRYHFYSDNGYFYISKDNIPELIEMSISMMDSQWFIAIRLGIDDSIKADSKQKVTAIDYLSIKRIIQYH